MIYDYYQMRFPSAGMALAKIDVFAPKYTKPVGIIQLAHGMQDYVLRYEKLAHVFNDLGFVFAGNNHLGHGETARSREDFGFFASKDGVDALLLDMKKTNELLKNDYPGIPVIMLGHSMGSFLARLYTALFPETVSGLIIHGTGGKNPLAPLGKVIATVIKKIYGERHKSKLITKMAFGSYNKKFPKEEGRHAWLTRDLNLVSGRDSDGFQNFGFTVSAYSDLFDMLIKCNKPEWFESYPKNMPTLVISGDADPVGNYGKGPRYVYEKLKGAGVTNIELKLYEGARHELFNETNREEVYKDLIAWVTGIVPVSDGE